MNAGREWGAATTFNDALEGWRLNGWEDFSPSTTRRYQARRGPLFAFGFPIAFPLLMIGLFSQLYSRITKVPGFPGTSYIVWMAPAVFLMAAMFGSGYSPAGLVTDIESGYLERLRLLPIRPAAIMLGRLLFDVVQVLIAGTLVLAASVGLGAHFDGGPLDFVAMLAVLALWTLGYTGLCYLVGLRSRSQQKLAVLIPMFLPISLLSTAYVPAKLAPGWIRTASRINPYSHVVDAVRRCMAGTADWHVLITAFAAGMALVALTQLGAARAFAHQIRTDTPAQRSTADASPPKPQHIRPPRDPRRHRPAASNGTRLQPPPGRFGLVCCTTTTDEAATTTGAKRTGRTAAHDRVERRTGVGVDPRTGPLRPQDEDLQLRPWGLQDFRLLDRTGITCGSPHERHSRTNRRKCAG